MLTHRLPYPPNKGERIRSYHWLKALSSRHEVDLLSLADHAVPDRYLSRLQRLAENVWVVRRNRLAAAWGLLQALFSGKGLSEGYFYSRRFDELLGETLCSRQYDLCLAICSSMGAYMLDRFGPWRLVVDLIDADSEKWRQYALRCGGFRGWMYRRESVKVRHLEWRLIRSASATVTVSDEERRLLRPAASASTVRTIANGVDSDYFAAAGHDRPINSLVFVGQMDYLPNVDAVTWFARHVWAQLCRRYPHLRWRIVGRRPVRAVRRLESLPNVTVTGEVADVRPFMASAISIAPLRLGCGVQNKVLEAMAAGRPVVASPLAARGLDVKAQEELLVADDPRQWLWAVELLLSDAELANRIGRNARAATLQRFTWDRVERQMLALVSGQAVVDESCGLMVSRPTALVQK